VAHQINNPINVIYGNLKLLKDRCAAMRRAGGGAGTEAIRQVPRMIADALKAADQAREVIEVFRNFARDTRAAEPSDLNRCLEETLVVARRWLAKVKVVRDLGKLPPVPCFPGQIHQVLLNLVKNAVEAMGGRGTLRVRTLRRGGRAVVEIADSGPGVPAAIRAKIFEPFFTTKPDGMGLGLSVSASIVQHHGGRIAMRPGPRGKGAVFRVELPLRARKG
jgi:signal transduction histidine kinase